MPSEDEDDTSHDGSDWTIPADRGGVYDVDPWSVVIDDWAEEIEHRYQYSAGLP